MQYRLLRALMMLFATHAPPCSSSFDTCGKTPLDYAAMQGHEAVVQLLLSCNAAVDARASLYGSYSDHCIVDENTQLISCCAVPLIFAILIPCSFSKNTPLHCAATHGHVDVCRALVSAKADITARGDMCDAVPLAARAHDAVCHSRASLQFVV